jgi:hypothetical protein
LGRIAPEANLDELAPNQNLCEPLDIEPFDVLNPMVGVHEGLKVEIPESDYGRRGTLRTSCATSPIGSNKHILEEHNME